MNSALLTDYPELTDLSRDDLQDLLMDPAYFQAIFHSLARVKVLYAAQSELGMANEAIARNNLALQEHLYALRSETKEAFDEAKQLELRWAELEKEQKEVYSRLSPQFLLMRLRHATTAQDDKSEALASAFIQSTPNRQQQPALALAPGTGTPQNGRDIDEFVREFKELRKVYHKRVMWGEKWGAGQVEWRDE
ncbi:hypothetical protein BDV98DRAFT_507174 [Pterulicium gracile]|uniref:VPS37 C-terminal domain-containing protein n=1 Tax=Pterulicium gracile TaxID=1884261 RepID=A0A5C3QI68_9AGAR|nr:hypothetical protein BDV98DRAFT_507174 [Pterula gracilis]